MDSGGGGLGLLDSWWERVTGLDLWWEGSGEGGGE